MNFQENLTKCADIVEECFSLPLRDLAKIPCTRTLQQTPYRVRCDNILMWNALSQILARHKEYHRIKKDKAFKECLDDELEKRGIFVVNAEEAYMKYETRRKMYQKRQKRQER
jgi:hypothetical protein